MEDLPHLVRYANNFRVWKMLTNHFPHPYSKSDGQNFIIRTGPSKKAAHFAIAVEGHAAGSISIFLKDDLHIKCAELGYWLAEPFWGRGIMTEVAKEMVEYAFNYFDIVRLQASTFSSNPGSQRVLEKSGFEPEARLKKNIFKNGEFLDELIYAIVR